MRCRCEQASQVRKSSILWTIVNSNNNNWGYVCSVCTFVKWMMKLESEMSQSNICFLLKNANMSIGPFTLHVNSRIDNWWIDSAAVRIKYIFVDHGPRRALYQILGHVVPMLSIESRIESKQNVSPLLLSLKLEVENIFSILFYISRGRTGNVLTHITLELSTHLKENWMTENKNESSRNLLDSIIELMSYGNMIESASNIFRDNSFLFSARVPCVCHRVTIFCVSVTVDHPRSSSTVDVWFEHVPEQFFFVKR